MQGQTFNPREHLINIKNGKGVSEYLEVKWRLVWFRQECPQGTIETEIVHLDMDKDVEAEAFVWNAEKRRSEKVIKPGKGVVIFRATVHDGKGGSATGTKSENGANFPDFIEKAESGSIGRALAALGYGTQFAPELNEEQRIVDAPVERKTESAGDERSSSNGGNNGAQTANTRQTPVPARHSPPTIQTPPPARPAQSDSVAAVTPSAEVLQEEVARLRIVAKDGASIGWKEVVRKALDIHNKTDLQAALSRHLTEQERRLIDDTIKPFRQTVAAVAQS